MNTGEADVALYVAADQLSQQLHRSAAALGSGRIAVLLDPSRQPLDEADLAQWKHASAKLHIARLQHSDVAWNRCPVLAEVDSGNWAGSEALAASSLAAYQELQPASLRAGKGRSTCSWWLSDAPYSDLALHLARMMLQSHPRGGAVWLRLQDPRVLWALWPLLGPAQQGSLLGPAAQVLLLDPKGQVQTLAPVPGARKGLGIPLRLSPAQWGDIGNIEALQQMLMGLDLLAYTDLEQLRSTAMAALRRAHAAGLDDRNDLATFAAKAVTVHPNFDRHPQIAALLAHKQADDYFTALIDDLSVSDWQRIAHDMDVPLAITPVRN